MDIPDQALPIIFLIGTIVFCGIVGFCCAASYEGGEESVKKEAILNGLAYYDTDEEGKPKFTWIEVEDED